MTKELNILKILVTAFSFLAASNAHSESENFIKLKRFKSWDVISSTEIKKKACHAISVPYKSEIFLGKKGLSILSLSYKGYKSFTFSVNPGIELSIPNGVGIIINGREHKLYAEKDNATTYSIDQDIALINKIISSAEFIKVRIHGKNGELIEDFYSTDGIKDAMIYMNKNCND